MTTTTDAKSIRYDRSTRDYRAEYEGQLVGFYGSYHAAEVALDAYVYELLQDTAVETADMEAEQAALVSDDEPLLVDPVTGCDYCPNAADWRISEGRSYACETCYREMFDEQERASFTWEAERITVAPPACIGAFSDTPCANPADITGFCPRCQGALTRIGHAARLISERRTRDVHTAVIERSLATCRNCGGAHHIQHCEEIRALLLAPIVRRVLEAV